VKGGHCFPLQFCRYAAVRISNVTIDLLDWKVPRKNAVGLSNPRERYHLTSLQDVSS
jgi:hypothetical protein